MADIPAHRNIKVWIGDAAEARDHGRCEERTGYRVQVGIAQSLPTHGFGALPGTAVAEQPGLWTDFRDVGEDRGVLGQDVFAIDDDRYRTGGVGR